MDYHHSDASQPTLHTTLEFVLTPPRIRDVQMHLFIYPAQMSMSSADALSAVSHNIQTCIRRLHQYLVAICTPQHHSARLREGGLYVKQGIRDAISLCLRGPGSAAVALQGMRMTRLSCSKSSTLPTRASSSTATSPNANATRAPVSQIALTSGVWRLQRMDGPVGEGEPGTGDALWAMRWGSCDALVETTRMRVRWSRNEVEQARGWR
jgi:hypothetical protein